MSTSQGIQRPASGWRSAAGAALAALGVLVAVGVGALMITSMSASRPVRSPSLSAPRLESCSGRGYRPRRRTSRTLLPVYDPVEHRLPGCTAETAAQSRLASHGSPDAHQR
jgi:hypothetical protein